MLLGSRWYSPILGRFLSRDPIGFGGGMNLYAYCAGDPVNYTDPSGNGLGPMVDMMTSGGEGLGTSGGGGGVVLAAEEITAAAATAENAGATATSDAVAAVANAADNAAATAVLAAPPGGSVMLTVGGEGPVATAARSVTAAEMVSTPALLASEPLATEASEELTTICPIENKPRGPRIQHHVLPQEFRDRFARLSIDVDDFCVGVNSDFHSDWVHGEMKWDGSWGNGGRGGYWNREWKDFFAQYQDGDEPTREEVFEQARQMMQDNYLGNEKFFRYNAYKGNQ